MGIDVHHSIIMTSIQISVAFGQEKVSVCPHDEREFRKDGSCTSMGQKLLFYILFVKRLFLIASIFAVLVPNLVRGQELPRPSMSQETEPRTLPTDYNMKLGPVLFNLTSSLEGEYIDNIGLSSTGAQSDFTLTPEVGVAASWPVTKTNTLSLTTSLGYTKYLF